MEKYIPYEKRSKKEQRKLDRQKRNTWGALNPITRKPENPRAYNRKKMQRWKNEFPNAASFYASSLLCLSSCNKAHFFSTPPA